MRFIIPRDISKKIWVPERGHTPRDFERELSRNFVHQDNTLVNNNNANIFYEVIESLRSSTLENLTSRITGESAFLFRDHDRPVTIPSPSRPLAF